MSDLTQDKYTLDLDAFEEDLLPPWQIDFKSSTPVSSIDRSKLSKDLPPYWVKLISSSNHLKQFARPLNNDELRQTVVPIDCGEFYYSEPQCMSDDVFGFGQIIVESELLKQDLAYFEIKLGD